MATINLCFCVLALTESFHNSALNGLISSPHALIRGTESLVMSSRIYGGIVCVGVDMYVCVCVCMCVKGVCVCVCVCGCLCLCGILGWVIKYHHHHHHYHLRGWLPWWILRMMYSRYSTFCDRIFYLVVAHTHTHTHTHIRTHARTQTDGLVTPLLPSLPWLLPLI